MKQKHIGDNSMKQKHISDIWMAWNYYNVNQMVLAKQYNMSKSVISYVVNARNKTEAWKRYKRTNI